MADAPASLDLTLHVDPTGGKATVEAEIEKEIGHGVELDADVQVDQDGKPTVTAGVKIPF
jgi:hypothetical protein